MLYDPSKDLNEADRLILKAADYMDEHGHVQGTLWDDDGRVCAQGAVLRVGKMEGYPQNNIFVCKALSKLNKQVRLKYGRAGIVTWNNEPGRTKEEVVDFFRQIAYVKEIV